MHGKVATVVSKVHAKFQIKEYIMRPCMQMLQEPGEICKNTRTENWAQAQLF